MDYDDLFNIDPRESYHYIDEITTQEKVNDIANIIKGLFFSELEQYQALLSIYQSLILKISDFVVEEVGRDEIKICAALAEMMWRGYFSKNKEFVYSYKQNPNELSAYMGVSILTGEACCRHARAFFNDILRDNRIKSDIIGNFFYDLDGSLFDTKIKRHNIDERLLSNCFFNNYQFDSTGRMNHTGVMFDYLEYTLIFDPINVRFFAVKNIQGIELDGIGKIVINPFSLALFSGYEASLIKDRMDDIKKKKIIKNTNRIRQLFYEGIDSIVNNLSYCEDFYSSIRKDLDEAYQYVLKIDQSYDS